jgi:hypothetical protein
LPVWKCSLLCSFLQCQQRAAATAIGSDDMQKVQTALAQLPAVSAATNSLPCRHSEEHLRSSLQCQQQMQPQLSDQHTWPRVQTGSAQLPAGAATGPDHSYRPSTLCGPDSLCKYPCAVSCTVSHKQQPQLSPQHTRQEGSQACAQLASVSAATNSHSYHPSTPGKGLKSSGSSLQPADGQQHIAATAVRSAHRAKGASMPCPASCRRHSRPQSRLQSQHTISTAANSPCAVSCSVCSQQEPQLSPQHTRQEFEKLLRSFLQCQQQATATAITPAH